MNMSSRLVASFVLQLYSCPSQAYIASTTILGVTIHRWALTLPCQRYAQIYRRNTTIVSCVRKWRSYHDKATLKGVSSSFSNLSLFPKSWFSETHPRGANSWRCRKWVVDLCYTLGVHNLLHKYITLPRLFIRPICVSVQRQIDDSWRRHQRHHQMSHVHHQPHTIYGGHIEGRPMKCGFVYI